MDFEGLPANGYQDGLAEAGSFVRFINNNTVNAGCRCDLAYDCNGQTFGLPKNRPWTVDGDRSYDTSYVFAGFDQQHVYLNGAYGYKNTDDPRPINERSGAWDSSAYVIRTTNVPPDLLNFQDQNPNKIKVGNSGAGTAGFTIKYIDNPPTLGFLTGFSGFTINPVPFKPNCEQYANVTLRLVANGGANDIPVTLYLQTETAETYPGTTRPDQRMGLVSSPLNFVIPGGFAGVLQLDIKKQFIEAITPTPPAGALGPPQYDGSRMGFILVVTNTTTDFATVTQGSGDSTTAIDITYVPTYKIQPRWPLATVGVLGQNGATNGSVLITNTVRKSHGIAFDYTRDRFLVFGGIDGRAVLNDAWEFHFVPPNNNVFTVANIPGPLPPARWGHSLVYDKAHDWYMLFGGFDINHHPLNDVWLYIPNATLGAGSWVQVPRQASTDQTPPPRGGCSMAYFGDFDYNRGEAGYFVGRTASINAQRVVMFGGTDGNTFFNDTWIFDGATLKWTMVNPSGIWGGNGAFPAPMPRAFAAMAYAQNELGDYNPAAPIGAGPAVMLYGGRIGALPTGRDTDFDMVDDGTEAAINGNGERDPTVNKMFLPADGRPETMPYNFVRMGSIPPGWPFISRGAIADFESMNYEDSVYASFVGLPYEPHPLSGRISQVGVTGTEPGVDANTIQETQLWYHQSGKGSPFDPGDAWQLGEPDPSTAGTSAVPPKAYSGRWCYGTKLNGFYPNNAIMDLYSPLNNIRA